MLNINRRNSASTGVLLNNQGFTFISALLMITIIFMLLPFTAYLTKGVHFTNHYEKLSLQQVYYFLREDVIKSTSYSVSPGRLTLNHYDGSVVTIEKYQDVLRRQIDGKGHEIYLRNVKSVIFTERPQGFHVSITSKEGDHFEKEVIFYP